MLVALSGAAAAQQPAGPTRARGLELSAGALVLGPVDFGPSAATLTSNSTGGGDLTLFRSDTEIRTAIGVDARVAWAVTRVLAIEGGFVWTRPEVRSRIASDVEGIPDTTLTQDLDTYFFEGSAVVHLTRAAFGGNRGVPFLSGGAGYMRQLDDEHLLVGDGAVYHAGGGLKYFARPGGRLGLRADARVYVRTAGLELDPDTSRRITWALGGGVVVRMGK
jgi:hypothetical protein